MVDERASNQAVPAFSTADLIAVPHDRVSARRRQRRERGPMPGLGSQQLAG